MDILTGEKSQLTGERSTCRLILCKTTYLRVLVICTLARYHTGLNGRLEQNGVTINGIITIYAFTTMTSHNVCYVKALVNKAIFRIESLAVFY